MLISMLLWDRPGVVHLLVNIYSWERYAQKWCEIYCGIHSFISINMIVSQFNNASLLENHGSKKKIETLLSSNTQKSKKMICFLIRITKHKCWGILVYVWMLKRSWFLLQPYFATKWFRWLWMYPAFSRREKNNNSDLISIRQYLLCPLGAPRAHKRTL